MKSKGPKLPVQCRNCPYYDPVAEAYACCVCEVVTKRDAKLDKKVIRGGRRGDWADQ